MEEIMEQIASMISQHDISIDLEQITDIEKASARIVPVLVNTEKNKELLQKSPHREIEDLSVMYRIELKGTAALPDGEANGSVGSVLISNPILETYGLTEEELYQLSLSNMELLPERKPEMKSLREVMAEMMGIPVEAVPSEGPSLYVLSNGIKMDGASVLLSETFMQSVREKVGDIYILPSSIHECLAISKADADLQSLREMVSEVNATQVAPPDILSDNVYEYTAEGFKVATA